VEKVPYYEAKEEMKRIGNLYHKICSVENLQLADKNARKGKTRSVGVRIHDAMQEENIQDLHQALKNKTFKTSPYHTFMISDPKVREIYQLPYYPDRIVHHAVMNVLEPVWMSVFTTDTYSCIKGRGIHAVVRKLKRELNDRQGTSYCLKLDIRKFYPTIDHDILKAIIRHKIKDKDLLWLLDSVIDSAPGVPIGNYLSQYFANLYLAYFDHWIKEDRKVRYYYRYADDMVILAETKEELHKLLQEIIEYLATNLKLELKSNYQVFPVDARGIDFVGYRFFHTHVLLRKSIKKSFARAIKRSGSTKVQAHAAYWGWAKHCNSRNLIKKLTA
jgi:retron-type reverse transcriptase